MPVTGRTLRGTALVLAFSASVSAVAQSRAVQASSGEPIYAVHPLIVVGEPGPLARELEAGFQEELRALGVQQVSREQVAAFLKTRERGQCLDDACLAALAKATGATHALRMTLAPHAPQFAITGKIIGTDEVEKLGISRNVEKSGGPLAAAARAAMGRVLRIDMALGEAELADLTPETTPEPIVKTVVVDKTPPWRKPAAYATAGLAGASLVGGVVMKVLANGKWAEANEMRAAGTLTPAQNQELAEQMGVAQRDNTIAISALVGGALLGAASGFLFATSGDAGPSSGAASTKPTAAIWSDGRGAFALISVPLP